MPVGIIVFDESEIKDMLRAKASQVTGINEKDLVVTCVCYGKGEFYTYVMHRDGKTDLDLVGGG